MYRQAIKSIRIREERVSDVRELKRALQSRLAQLESAKRKQPERISDTLSQLASVEQDAAVEEQELAEFKRLALREAFYLRFNALTAYAEKANMIAGFGKYLTDLFEVSEKETVYNQKVANTIFSDAVEALDRWVPTQSDERPTINESLPKKDIDDKKKKSKKKKDQDEDDGKKGKSKTNKKNKKKKEQKQDQEEHDEEVEEPLTPPELPPRLAHHQPFSVSENPPTPYLEYDHYHQRAHSSSSMMSTDSRDQYEFYQAPPPSYDLSQTSLTESNSNTSPTIIRSEVQQQTKDDDDDDDDTDHLNSGPSSLLPFLTYYPVEHIHRQVQNNNKHNNRSYMEFSLQYAHRPVQQLSPAPPLPPPRSRSVTTLPLSMSAPSAPSAPTQDEIHFLPIPSAPPPSELSEY